MSKILIITIFIFAVVLFSCSKPKNDKKVIQNFLQELRFGKLSNDTLYNNFFVTGNYEGEGRNIEDIKYYIDTIFPAIKEKIKDRNIEILTLREASNKYPNAQFYTSYYDGQDKEIYICNLNSVPNDTNVIYILMYNHKIISTKASAAIEGKIVKWF